MSTVDEALEEIDAVNGQLAWSAAHPHVARPETVGLLYDRLDAAQRRLAELSGDQPVHPVEAIERLSR